VSTREGPALEPLLRRVTDTPEDFLAEPMVEKKGEVHVAAVVGDLCDRLRIHPAPGALAVFAADGDVQRRWLGVTLVQAWLLADPAFTGASVDAVLALLHGGAVALAKHATAKQLVADADRREELVRYCLAHLGLHPAGERADYAADRLTSLSAAERARLLAASRAAEARAREIREALARKAAEESADKWTRE
jgi:hypothetical protein